MFQARTTLGLLLAFIAVVQALQGEIKDPGHVDQYRNLRVNWTPGHNPELHIKDDNGQELEVVDLSRLTTDQIHALVKEKGFEKKEGEF